MLVGDGGNTVGTERGPEQGQAISLKASPPDSTTSTTYHQVVTTQVYMGLFRQATISTPRGPEAWLPTCRQNLWEVESTLPLSLHACKEDVLGLLAPSSSLLFLGSNGVFCVLCAFPGTYCLSTGAKQPCLRQAKVRIPS